MLLSILLIIFLALLRLHSGESSQKSERSAVHFCAHVHNNPLHTCSPTHLIAADSSHCWRHRSPSSALCCYCISATRFYPPFPPPLLQFRTFLRFFPTSPHFLYPSSSSPPLPAFLPLALCRNLASTLFALARRSRENYNSYPGLRLSPQIMTSDLCLYHVFSGTLFTRLAGASRSLQHNTAIQ